MKKNANPFLKKSSGEKPMNRNAMRKAQAHGLGRGLGALVGVPAAVKPVNTVSASVATLVAASKDEKVTETNTVMQVPPMEIERSPWQPRTEFEEEALKELSESIKSNGVIQPLVCRRNTAGKIELIAGERRLRASVIAGLKKVPVVLIDAPDRQAAEMAVIENIQRRDLNVIEEAEGYRLLKEQFELRQEDVADRVGKSRPAVANALRLLELPDEVKQLITQNLISTGHAKLLLSVDDVKERIILARDCVNEGLTVRALERKIARRHAPPTEKRVGVPDLSPEYVRTLTDAVRRYLGCAVRLTPGVTHANGKHTKGLLEIDFADNDDLDRILMQLGVKVD